MKFNFCIISLILALFVSCKKDTNDAFKTVQWNMNRVEGPTSGKVDKAIVLTVYYTTSSSCDIFDRFGCDTHAYYFSYKAYGHTESSSLCIEAEVEKYFKVKLTPLSAGIYELRFINKDDTYLTHNLTINE